MSAQLFILPIVARPNFEDADWLEQYHREREQLRRIAQFGVTPARTRALLVVDNPKPEPLSPLDLAHRLRQQFDRNRHDGKPA